MLKSRYGLLRILLPALLMLGVLGSCGGGGDGVGGGGDSDFDKCEVPSLRNEFLASLSNDQKRYNREDYYPMRFSKRDYPGADISPTEEDYDIVRKVSRSVFEIEFGTRAQGTGWLAAPRYVVTAAHNLGGTPIVVHTFDGDTIEAEKVVYHDPHRDLALLRLPREIDAVPLKITDGNPGKNEFLMAMGAATIARGLGGWMVSAGPALELKDERVEHAVPLTPGMSGGPIFNRMGEVVSIATRIRTGGGMVPTDPPERLWIYAFVQQRPNYKASGSNPAGLREVFDKIPDDEKPINAGNYSDKNEWTRAENEFGDEYSPFPLDRFEHMQTVYRKAREATVTVYTPVGQGAGFIYDENTVITAGHVGGRKDNWARIRTEKDEDKDKFFDGKVLKTQYQGSIDRGCDIAVIEMNEPLSGYPTLNIGDSSSLKCGDPLVGIGSADAYNSVGHLQGVGIVHHVTKEYISEYTSKSAPAGMSGGPIVDKNGEVVSLLATNLGRVLEAGEWVEPGPLYIRTRIPVYKKLDFSLGPSAEIMKRFVEEDGFLCPLE